MKFIRITDDTSAEQIAEAIRHLRQRQERTESAQVRADVGETIDELVDLYLERVRVAR